MRKGYRLQVTGYSLLLFVLLSTVHCTLYPTFAADSTPSADPLRQSDSEASIKIKLEELKKEIASKAARLKQEVNRKLKDKAYIGQVKSKSNTTLTLAAESGPKVVTINEDTVFESNIKSKPGQAKFTSKTVSEENFIAALGDADDTDILTAKKIILLQAAKLPPKTYLWGQVISISDQLVTLKNSEFKNVAVALPDQPDIKINDFVILTGNKDKNEIFDAGFVYVIPQGGFIKPKKIATPSAKIGSPSAKPAKKAN